MIQVIPFRLERMAIFNESSSSPVLVTDSLFFTFEFRISVERTGLTVDELHYTYQTSAPNVTAVLRWFYIKEKMNLTTFKSTLYFCQVKVKSTI